MDKCLPLKAFLNASVKADKLSDLWGQFNKTVTCVAYKSLKTIAILVNYTCESFIKLTCDNLSP